MSIRMRSPRRGTTLVLLLLVILVWFARERMGGGEGATPPAAGALESAYAAKRSVELIEVAGTVDRLLADDREGSEHQRFILRLDSGLTVLVAHNIDLAPRVPVSRGDALRLRGEYEYNDKGGVLHWTHHDPRGQHPGGWIELDGKRYE